jgi:RNA polymerase sigma-70 factor (ECF subfamily)
MKISMERKSSSAASPSEIADRTVRALLTESYGLISNYLQKRFETKADADEVLQAFLLRALDRSADIRNVESVRGWLSRILATTIADFHRKTSKSRRRELSLTAELNERLAAEQGDELDGVVCECLHTQLSFLKAEHAEVIRRIDLDGEPREKVAAEMGVSVNNLTVRLHRARRSLKGRLEEMCKACLEDGFLDCRCGSFQRGQPR